MEYITKEKILDLVEQRQSCFMSEEYYIAFKDAVAEIAPDIRCDIDISKGRDYCLSYGDTE